MGFHVGQCVSTEYGGKVRYGIIISWYDPAERFDILLYDGDGDYYTTDRKPKELKEAIPELFPNYERVQELLHIRFDWFSNEIMEPYYHVAVLKSLQYDDFIQCLKIKEREVLLSYIEDCLFDKGYTQCTIYFGDIAKETEFEYSEYSAVLYY